MKKALLLICAASILAGMCGCSKTIEPPPYFTPKNQTTSSTTPVPQTVTPQTTAVTTAATSTQTTKAETTTAKPETSNTSTDKSEDVYKRQVLSTSCQPLYLQGVCSGFLTADLRRYR